MANAKPIKPLEAYDRTSDPELIARATAVLTGLTGNTNYANPPIDLVTLKANIDSLSTLMAESKDGIVIGTRIALPIHALPGIAVRSTNQANRIAAGKPTINEPAVNKRVSKKIGTIDGLVKIKA